MNLAEAIKLASVWAQQTVVGCDEAFAVVLEVARQNCCTIHGALRATQEDPTVCWEYEGREDCHFK